MFKKSIAVLLTLMYVSCLNAYAKQSDAQKLSLIDDKIAEYTQEKSQGVTRDFGFERGRLRLVGSAYSVGA